MNRLTITKLERHDEDYYTARLNLSDDGEHVGQLEVSNRYGSWQTIENGSQIRQEVMPAVAAELQAKLPRSDRGRR